MICPSNVYRFTIDVTKNDLIVFQAVSKTYGAREKTCLYVFILLDSKVTLSSAMFIAHTSRNHTTSKPPTLISQDETSCLGPALATPLDPCIAGYYIVLPNVLLKILWCCIYLHFILHYSTLEYIHHGIAWHCRTWHYIVSPYIHSFTSHRMALHCIALRCIPLHNIALHCDAR